MPVDSSDKSAGCALAPRATDEGLGSERIIAMGQAALDLPDPLQQQPAGASSADDLLSQLAGDEIDRLLTESDTETPDEQLASEPTPLATPTSELPAIDPLAASHAQESVVVEADQDKLTTLEHESHPAEPGADLHSVLSTSMEGAPPADPLPAAKIDIDQHLATDADRVLAPHTAELKADGIELKPHGTDDQEDASERQGLLATMAAEATDEDITAGPLPIWLRPLEWLNAPMDALSDEVRSFFGKAAILTLVNSAAVIAYVLLFRRH